MRKETIAYIYEVEPVSEKVRQDKKENMAYHDQIEKITRDYITRIFQLGGVRVWDIKDEDIVKQVAAYTQKRVKEDIPELDFPFVDEDY